MPVKLDKLYEPRIPEGDLEGLIQIKSKGDFFSGKASPKGCCGTPSGWKEYSARLKIPMGIITPDVMENIAKIAKKYGRGEVYITARLGLEIPGIPEDLFPALDEDLAKTGVALAGCGPRMRSVVTCKGTVCVHGNFDTFRLAWDIDKKYNNGKTLPHKFKVAIAGCAISCSKPQLNDVGLISVYEPFLNIDQCLGCDHCVQACTYGAITLDNGKAVFEKNLCSDCGYCAKVCPAAAIMGIRAGIDLYAGGQWGKDKQVGIKIGRFLSESDTIKVIGSIKDWYAEKGREKERLGSLILRLGIHTFQESVLKEINKKKWHKITDEDKAGFQILK